MKNKTELQHLADLRAKHGRQTAATGAAERKIPMPKPRAKTSLAKPELETQEDFRAAVTQIAADMLAERELKNALDARLQAVRLEFETDLLDLAQDIELRTELCAEYATRHPDLFPRDAKSLDLGVAVVGFRTGTPKVKALKRWTLSAALDAIKSRKWFQFIRTTEELDKEAIIAARAEFPNDKLAAVGLAVVQDETFFVQPNLSAQPSGVKAETA